MDVQAARPTGHNLQSLQWLVVNAFAYSLQMPGNISGSAVSLDLEIHANHTNRNVHLRYQHNICMYSS